MRVFFIGGNAINTSNLGVHMGKILIFFLTLNAAQASQINKLYDYLNGSFTSANQSIYNSNFFDVTVRNCPVNIIGGNSNSRYLLLRQSISLFQESPYRVRLVELLQDGNLIKSKNYAPINELDLSETCDNNNIPTFLREDFSLKPKCILSLYEDSDKFIGSTGRPGCSSQRNGASFVSSDVEVTSTYFKSLDRGWDNNGNQVWGSTNGAYVFEKKVFNQIYPNLVELAAMLVGETSNQEQFSNNEDDFLYVRNKTCPIKVLNSSSLNLITNQIVYRGSEAITRTSLYRLKPIEPNSTYSDPIIEAYSIDDSNYFNYCDQPSKWNQQYSLKLEPQPCTIAFSKGIIYGQPTYFGTTPDKGCPSRFRGAVRLEIDEDINFQRIKVLEKWFDDEGNQVAGSKAGPYIYKKEKQLEVEYNPIK